VAEIQEKCVINKKFSIFRLVLNGSSTLTLDFLSTLSLAQEPVPPSSLQSMQSDRHSIIVQS
jgi:hypothetical protein